MSLQAFGPRGNTANIAVTQTASTAVKVESNPASSYTYQFINEGSSKCFFAWGAGPGVVAQIPTPGSPKPSVCVLPNEIVIYNLTPNAWISAICEAGGSTNLLVTPGEGM